MHWTAGYWNKKKNPMSKLRWTRFVQKKFLISEIGLQWNWLQGQTGGFWLIALLVWAVCPVQNAHPANFRQCTYANLDQFANTNQIHSCSVVHVLHQLKVKSKVVSQLSASEPSSKEKIQNTLRIAYFIYNMTLYWENSVQHIISSFNTFKDEVIIGDTRRRLEETQRCQSFSPNKWQSFVPRY